jgi:signal transduction histidine kinase
MVRGLEGLMATLEASAATAATEAPAAARPRLRRMLENRSGRVVAIGRAILACYFIFVLWADPKQPQVHEIFADLFLWSYVALSAAYVLLTWNRWWLEARLSLPFHALDLLVFTALNYVTSGYASPFFLFFIFILLSSSLRWGWRETLATGAALILIYAIEGLSASTWGTEAFDLERFALRVMYMVVFSALMLLWFASRSGAARPIVAAGVQPKGAEEFFRQCLPAVAERLGARHGLVIWSDEEEPWHYVVSLSGGRIRSERVEPEAFDPIVAPAAGDEPIIFDLRRGAILRGRWPRTRSEAVPDAIGAGLAERYDLSCGLRLPLRTGDIQGELLIGDIEGLSPDDLDTAALLRDEVVGALERVELVQANERSAIMRARLSFARDVHDGMVQFLAGVALRLEGLKRTDDPKRLRAEIDELQAELAREQQDLRALIRRLKGSGLAPGEVDAAQTLKPLADRLARQWGIDLRVEEPEAPVLVDRRLETDIHNLVREAAANAARHGGARRVAVSLGSAAGWLHLQISDNGRGLEPSGRFRHDEIAAGRIGPRSIFDRVQQRGGTIDIDTGRSGTLLSIVLPVVDLAA